MLTRITHEGTNFGAVWTPDGARLTFSSNVAGTFDLYQKVADESGETELLLETSTPVSMASWSADGTLVFHELMETGTERDLWVLRRDGAASPFLATEFNELAPSVSPDGRWLAYVSDSSGEDRVYVQPFPDGGTVEAELFIRGLPGEGLSNQLDHRPGTGADRLGDGALAVRARKETFMPAQDQPIPAPIDLDVDVLRDAIRDEYAAVADEPTRGFHFHTGRPLTRIVG